MKHITVFVGFVMLVLLTGARPVPADPCQLTGSGAKIREHPVQPVAPGGPITVRIIKTHPGYAAGSLDRSGEDSDGDDVILDHRARRGLVWAVAGGGITTLEHTSSRLTADELAVVGIPGASGAKTTVTPCVGVCTPP
jgi:hypothetical protein